ncbi:hypothetical protein [Streptomyces sp. NBC_00620]|uniref:hypothetical protein n=1 Tax=Streptomyces sp. NBC_00620 TaxID=2903666 RepID=UPI002254F447|nr:hypothetical protein [Streptomyces sp. NBC_00620]MCX4972195.1 helix-turn-helix domain-containing protein [Streptomyces sp. NBC_00620]
MSELSRELRQVLVRHLVDAGRNATEIAAELGISRHTARRDMETVVTEMVTTAAPDAPADERPVSADPRPGPEGVTLPPSDQLGKDLRLLAASYKGQPEDVARFAIHQAAEAVRARMTARFAAADAQHEVRS